MIRGPPRSKRTDTLFPYTTLFRSRGKPLLVNLWATWCAPCVAEMPTLDKLAAARGDAMTVIAVAMDLQGAEVVDPWFQKAGLTTLQPYLDPENALPDAAAGGLPRSAERRVGQEGVSTGRSRWSPYH